jgi:hypothetical protein
MRYLHHVLVHLFSEVNCFGAFIQRGQLMEGFLKSQ